MTKKEYLLQYIVIGVSIFTVFASVFAGIMAYKASINSADLSGKLNKNNEIETRIYQQKYELYQKIYNLFRDFYSQKNQFDSVENAIQLKKELKNYGFEIRVIGSDRVVCYYSVLVDELDQYIKSGTEIGAFLKTMFQDSVVPGIFELEKSFKYDLTNDIGSYYIGDFEGKDSGFSSSEEFICSEAYKENNDGIFPISLDSVY